MRDLPQVAVVGGGAAGLAAAVAAARRGRRVVVLERLPRTGRKLLATGGGRCNLLNERLSPSAFTSTEPRLVASVLGRFGAAGVRAFFDGLGLPLQTDEAGRVYPATNQAASVLRVLEIETARLGVRVEAGFEAKAVHRSAAGFRIEAADGRRIEAERAVLTCGGKSYPALGSNGSGYGLAAALGHRVVEPVPSAVPLVVKDPLCHFLQGQKLRARVQSRIGGRRAQDAEGELLFAQYGLSGPAALDVSERLSIALHREGRRDVSVVVDFLPFLAPAGLAAELARRRSAGWAAGDLLSGLLPEKFARLAPKLDVAGPDSAKERTGPAAAASRLAARLKAWEFPVAGTRGWNEAEFTSGGVDAREVDPGTLESRLAAGLFFAGEILDVQGGRGGFNLAWAWASGLTAGLGA